MVGRFGRGGLIRNVFQGIGEGLMDGGIGGGNILRNVAENIVTGGNGPGQTSRAVPGTLNFEDALDPPVVTPEVTNPEPASFTFSNDPYPPPQRTYVKCKPRPVRKQCGCKKTPYRKPSEMYPNGQPPTAPEPYPTGGTYTGPIPTATGFTGPMPSAASFGNTGDTPMNNAIPDPIPANPNINYGYPIGPQLGPNAVAPTVGAGCGGGCSCRRKYTCEEKCAYNAMMKEQCKGCKAYFRKTKQWVRPKRRYTRRKRTYRRKRKSSGLSLKKLSKYTKKPILNEDKCFALKKKLGSGKKLTKAEADYIQNCFRQGRITVW